MFMTQEPVFPASASKNFPMSAVNNTVKNFSVTIANDTFTHGSSNSSNITLARQSFFYQYYNYFLLYIVVASVICLFGVVSNMVCFLSICLFPKLRQRGNVLVANLVMINILLCGSAYPITLISMLYRQYRELPGNFCQWAIYYYTVVHTLTWQECLLALNRVVAVLLPHHYSAVSTKRSVMLTILLGYLIPLAINFYPVVSIEPSYIQTLPFGGCGYNPKADAFQAAHSILGVYLPMAVIGASYFSIFCRIIVTRYKQRHEPRALIGNRLAQYQESATTTRRVTLAKMLCSGFVWYCVTYLPQPLLTAAVPQVYAIHPTTYFYVRWLLHLGTGANAIIYAITNKDYRDGMLYVLRRKCTHVGPRTTSENTNHDIALRNTSASGGGSRAKNDAHSSG